MESSHFQRVRFKLFDSLSCIFKKYYSFFLPKTCQYSKYYYFCRGELAEWSIAAVLKTVELRGSGGSNPSLSAKTNAVRFTNGIFCFRLLPTFSVEQLTKIKKDTNAKHGSICFVSKPILRVHKIIPLSAKANAVHFTERSFNIFYAVIEEIDKLIKRNYFAVFSKYTSTFF